MQVLSLAREDPLEEGIASHPNILAWRIPMDRGAWQATVHGVAKSWTRLKWLITHACTGILNDYQFRGDTEARTPHVIQGWGWGIHDQGKSSRKNN